MRDHLQNVDPGADRIYKNFIFSHALVGEFFKIYLKNLFFTIITFGIYRFWAKTHNRRYIFSHMKVLGDGFEYTGTGRELFLGFCFVTGLIIVPIGVIPAVIADSIAVSNPELATLIHATQAIIFFCLFPVAIYRAYKYIFSRVNWRGVHFAQVGSTFGYWWRWMVFTLLMPFTAGLLYPVRHAVMTRYWVNNARFGNQVFQTDIKVRTLYKYYAISYIIMVAAGITSLALFGDFHADIKAANTLPNGELSPSGNFYVGALFIGFAVVNSIVIGMAMLFYYAAFINEAINGTRLNDCLFYAKISPFKLLGFQLVNLLLTVMMFGLSYPLIMTRYMEFISRNVQARGIETLEQTIEIDRETLKTGEGLADALDVGAF